MNILFLGKPGSGKGTITQRLEDDGFLHLSTGDLLRAEQEKDTELGRVIGALIDKGSFVSDGMIFNLVDKFLEENKDKNIVFDGFPRNLEQAKECIAKGIFFENVIVIDVPDELIKDRIVNRRVHISSGRVYNTKTLPSKVEGFDDITGEPLTHRDDDKEDVISKRISIYKEVTEPIVNFLEKEGHKIIKIDGTADIPKQVDEVKRSIAKPFKKPKIK